MIHLKSVTRFATVFQAAVLTVVVAFSSVWPVQTAQAEYRVTCESDNNMRRYCRTSTSGGVHLQTQLSKASCHQGSTWGYDSRGIWVSNGCRAIFKTGSDSYNYDHHDDHESSKAAAAVAGIALLAAGAAAAHKAHEDRRDDRYDDDYYEYRPNDYDMHYYNNRGQRNINITCESMNDRYNYCRAPIHHSHVRMVRRFSDSGCTFNRDWGYDQRGIWVENGCRASFEVE